MANEQEPFPWEDNYGADKPPWEDNYDTSAPFDAGPPSGVLRRGIADPLVGLAKGTLVGIPEAGYGLANLATGGLVGRGVEALNEATGAGTPASGFKMANEAFDSMLSPETQAAKQRVAEAEGFLPTLGAYAQNPSAIVQGITENVPGMFAMRGIGKAALGLAGKPVLQREAMATALEAAGGAKSAAGKALIAQNAARAATGAGIGEGAYTAGQNITQVMEQTGTDIMEPKSLLYNATAGMITGIISKLSGTLANKLGFTDIDVMMQGVAAGDFGKPMGILKTLFASAITEGLFEELPQSAQEQYFQNLSMGKADPWEGVAEAAASGLVIGAFMGLGGSTAAALRSHIDPTNRKIEDEINRLAEEVKTQSSFFGDTDEFDIESVVNDTQLNALSQDWNVFANNGLYYWSNKTNPAQSGVQKPEELSEEELRDWQGLARSTAQQTNLLDRAQKGDLEAQKALEESGVDWKPATQMDKVRADYREAMGENYNKSAEEVGLIDKIQNLDFTLGHPAIIDREFAKLSPKKQKALPGTSIAQKREAYKREIENERLAALDKIQEGQKKRDIKYQPRAASKAIILKDEQGKPLPELESARPDGRNNDTKFVKTPSQEKIKFKYHFIEAANLQPSHDRYGRENLLNTELDAQQRDRANKDSLAQIEKISNTLDFEEAAENYLSGFGAPLGVFNTAGDGNFSVISGTGRGAGIKYAYDVDKSKLADKKGFYEGAPLLGQKYKDDAIAAASRFGYTPEEVAAMNQPVLVREILTPVDRLELSRSTNISVTADRSDIEVGREDAQNMTPAMMHQFVLNADGSLNVAQSKDGIQNFRNIMAQRGEVNQGAYFTDEVPTDKFVKRILTAMFINAFEDDKLAFHIVNEENKTMNSVVRAMATVSDDYMALNEVAKDNPLNPIKDLVAAARIVRWAHEHNSTVPMAVNQPSLIDKDMTPEASMLAVAFGELSGEARNLRKMMNVLASSTKVEVANQGQFALPGVIKAKSKVELINDAILSVGLSISVSKQGSYQAVRFEPTSIENVEASAKAAEDEESSVNLAAPATPEQNYAWIKAWKSFRDVKARDNLIKHNARFVYGLAHTYKKYFPDADNKKAAFADLVQEGNIGLVEALDKYDLTAKTAFLTYAGWKVEANMQSYVQKNMGIVAEGKDVASRKYFRSLPGTMRALWQSVNLAGTESERSMLIEAAQSLGINDEQLARLRGRDESLSPVKTDEFDADEGTSNKAALSAASLLPAGETPESVMVGNEIHQLAGTIGSALSELDTTEKYIITNRILAEEPLTQSQIGLKFNMTKQRVGQIEKEALAKLKNKLAPMIREGAYEQRTIRKTGSGRDNGSVAEGRKGRHDRELAVEEREILKRSHKFNAELVQRIREEQRVTKFLKLLGIKRRGATAKAVERAYQNMLKMVNRSIPVNEETRPLLMQLQRGQVWDGGVYKSDLFNEENWEALDVKVGRDDTLLKRNRIIPELNLFKKLVDNGILTKDQVLTFLNTGGLKNLSLFKDGTEVEPILDIDKVSPARLERGGWRTMTEAEEAALVAQLEDVADKGEYPTTYRVLNKKTGKYENIPFPPLKSYLSGITEAGLRKEYDHYLATGLEKTLEIDEARYDDRSYLDSFELGRQYNMDVVPLKINKFVNALLLKYTDGSGTVFLARYGDIAVNFTGHEISEAKKTGPKGENNVQTRLHINRDSAAFGEYHAELTAALGHEVEVEYALKEMAADLQGGLLVNYGVILHNAVYHGQKIDYIVTPNRTAVREMKGAIPSFKGEAEAAQALIREHNTTPMKFGQAVDEYQRVTGAVFPYPAIIPLLDKMGTSVVYNKSPRTYFDKESNTIFIGSRIASTAQQDELSNLAATKKVTEEFNTEEADQSETKNGLAEIEQEYVHDELTNDEKSTISEVYGTASYNKEAKTRFIDDLVRSIDTGIDTVHEKLKPIIARIKAIVLAALAVFTFSHFTTGNIAYSDITSVQQQYRQVQSLPDSIRESGMSTSAMSLYKMYVPSARETGKPFIIADKPNGKIFVISQTGTIIASDNALFGKQIGDFLSVESNLEKMEDVDKITPAGVYTLKTSDKGMLVLKETARESIVGIHAVYLGDPSENRAERIKSEKGADKRISFGCINTTKDFLKDKIEPIQNDLNSSFVVVVPDNPEMVDKFVHKRAYTEASTKQPMLPGMPQRGRAPQRHKTMTGQTSLAGVPQQVKRTASPHSKIYPNLTQTALDLVTEPRKALPIQVVGQSKEGYMDILYDGKRLYRERIDAALHDKINSLLKNQNFKRAGEIISRNRDKDYVAPTVLTEEQKQKGLTEVRKIIDMLDTEASTKQQPVLPGLEKKQKFQPRPRTKNISQATLPGMAKETPPTKHVYDASKYNERQLQPSLNFEAPTDLELAGFADTEASVAWHGGFDWKPEAGFPHGRPRLDKVGTGEGAAVFSWGFYSAMLKAVAQEYYNGSVGQRFGASRGLTEALFETLSRRSEKRDAVIVKGKSYTRKEFMHAIDTADLYMDDFKLDDIHAARKLLGNPSLYKMDIPDDVDPKLLQWDMPTYRQTDYVQNILDKLGVGNVPSGSVLYGRVGEALVHPDESLDDSAKKIIKQYPNADWKELASRWLASHGIAGNKYEDQGSRYRGIVVMPKTGDWFFISGYRHDEHSITYDEWLNQTIEYDKEMYKDAKYYVIGTDEFIKARDFVENAEDYDDTNSIIDELNNEQMMNVLGITGEKQTLLPWGEKKKPLQSFLSLQDALDNLSKTASYNTVIWDQATLDRIILLEKNGKMLDAVQEYTGSRLVQDTEASVRPSKDRDSSELLGQALAIAGTEATIHHTLKSTSNLKYNSQHGLVNRGVVSLSLRNDLKKLYDNLAPYRNLTETTPEGKGWAEAKLIYDRIGKEGMESFPKYAFHSRAFAAWLNSIPDFERKRNAEYYEALDRANPTLWSKYRNVMLRMLGRVEKTERTKLDVIRDIMDRWVDVDLAKELSQYTVQIETDVARRFPKMMDYMRETNTPYPFGKVFEYTEEFMNKLPESQRNPDYIGLKVKRFKTGKGDTYIYEPIDMKNYVINRRKREYTDAVVARKGNLPRFITLSGGVKIGTQGLADEYTKTPVVNRGSVNWVSLRKRQIAEHKKVRNMSPEDRARYLRAYEVRLFGRGWEKESLYHGYRRRMAIWLSAMGAGKKNYEIMNNVAQILEAERRAIQAQPTQSQRFAEATQGVPKDVLLTRDASGISMRRGINWKMGEQKVTKGLYVGTMRNGELVTEKVPEGLEEVAKSKFAAAQNVQRGPTEKTAVVKKQAIKRQNRKRATGPSGLTYGLYEIVTKPGKIPYTTSNTFSVTQNGKDVGKVTMEPYGEVGIDGQKHQVMMIHDWTIDTLKSTRATLSKIFNDNPNISLIAAADISKEFTNYIVLSGGRISYTDGGRIAYITKDMRSDRIKRDSAVRQETLPLLSADQMSEIDEWNIATEARARREQINKNIEAKQIWLRRADELGVDEDLSDNQRIAQAVKIQNERRRDAVRGIRDDAFWLREANKQGIDKTLPEATRIEEAKVDYVETEPMQEGLFGGETPVSQLKAPRRTSMKTGKKQPKMQNRSIFDTEASVRDALFSIADNIPVKLPRSAAIQEFLRGGLLNVPTEEMDKFEQTAEQYGGIKNRTIRKIFSLPHANAKKHADWKTAFTSVMRMMDNKQRLEHEWLRKANVAINRRLYLKKDGYTNEQIAELDDKLASLLSLGDERLRDKSIAMMNQIKSMEKAPLLYSEEDIAPFRERFERMTKRNGYSYAEAVEQGIKDDDGNIVKLKDEKEYAIYHAITSTVRDVFDKQIQYLKDNALSQHETKAWYKLLTLALGERVTNETLDSIAGGLKTAVSNRTKVAVELKNLFSRINKNFDSQGVMDLGNSQRDQLRLLQSELDVLVNTKQNDAAELVRRQIAKLEKELVGVTQKEGDEVMKRYTKIAETSRQELEALRTYISAVTGITKEEEVEKLTREMFKAYQMTRPLMKRITDMKAEINQWVGFFPRIRHDGKWKMALYELYRDPKSGATKRKEVFSDFFTSDAEFNEVYGRAMNDFGKGGIFPEKYVTEYTPNKKETGIAYGDSTPSDMKLQKVLENSINSLNIEGNVFDENGKPIDLKRSLIEESFNAVSAQLLDRGAARHRIHRKQKVGQKAIKGYNETEFDKVLLNYITTMAGSLSKQQGAMDAMEILNNLKDKTLWPELKDYFSSMLRSDTKADRVSGQLRSFAFIWYLGLMVKSGFVNSTQPYIVGIPQLTNWMQGHGMKGRQAYPVQLKATADIARNFVKLIRKDPSEWGNLDGMTETEQRYLSEGLITGKMAAQQVRYIKGAASGWGKLKNDVFDIMAAPFAMVEIFNRLCSGLAMYRVAENYHTNHRGKEDDYESIFENAGIDADEFINNVHYPIGRHNRPSFMQSGDTVGATAETLYVFRTFTHNFLLGQFNLLRSGISDIRSDDKAKRAQASHDLLTVVHTMALLGLFGGLLGLPFFKDLFDWWEKEYGESPKLWLRETLNDLGGNTLENLGMNGLPAVLGGNISGSLAIGVPFISDKNELDSVFGVWGGLKEKAKRSASAFARGDVYRGVTNLTPEFLRGPIVALTESSFGESLGGRGLVTTASGMPVYSSTGEPLRMTAGESAIKALGFQPTRITKEREVEWSVKNTVTWANEQKRILTESYRIDRLQNKSGALKDLMNGIRELNAEIKDRKIPTPLAKVSTVVKNSRAKKTKQQLREIRAREAILQQ